MKLRTTLYTLLMAGVIALAVMGSSTPVNADGGPIPMCAPGTPGQPKQGPCKPYDPNHPF